MNLPETNLTPRNEAQRQIALKIAKRKALLLKQAYFLDCHRWMMEQVKTKDEHDSKSPVKGLPRLPYLPVILTELTSKDDAGRPLEPIVFIPKSRQMMVSWIICAYALWTAQFFPHRLVAVVSKKAEDAVALLERIRFIYANQSLWLKNLCPLDRQLRDMPMDEFSFEIGSKIVGMPQGSNQIRSYTASLIILDEADFQDQFDRTFDACLPSINGGGQLVAVSSIAGGPFTKICGL